MEASLRPPPPMGSQAIERAFAVLECFMGAAPELGIADIARRLELNPSTVHRIVRALMSAGYLDQNPRSGHYHLGRTPVLLGQIAQRISGLDLALPVLEDVSERTGESVNLGLRDDDAAIITLRVESRHALRFEQRVGMRVGLHCSSLGKALLAFDPDCDAVLRRLGRLEAHTTHTLSSRRSLEPDLRLTRRRGYSLDEQETQLGVRCIGAPVLDAAGRPRAALAVQIPTVRMPRERLPELAPLVLDAAERLALLISRDRTL